MPFVLTKIIERAFRNNGFEVIVIQGQQGVGKTTYAIKVLSELYCRETALNYVFFDVKQSFPIIRECLRYRKRVKCLCYDDAGVWISKYDFLKEDRQLFVKFLEVARTVTGAVIFTVPTYRLLLRALREMCWIHVHIRKSKQGEREAHIYRFTWTPTGKFVVKEIGVDTFVPKLDHDIYVKYQEMRRLFVEKVFMDLQVAIQTANREKTIEDMLKKGYSISDIARALGVSRQTVYKYIKKLNLYPTGHEIENMGT